MISITPLLFALVVFHSIPSMFAAPIGNRNIGIRDLRQRAPETATVNQIVRREHHSARSYLPIESAAPVKEPNQPRGELKSEGLVRRQLGMKDGVPRRVRDLVRRRVSKPVRRQEGPNTPDEPPMNPTDEPIPAVELTPLNTTNEPIPVDELTPMNSTDGPPMHSTDKPPIVELDVDVTIEVDVNVTLEQTPGASTTDLKKRGPIRLIESFRRSLGNLD